MSESEGLRFSDDFMGLWQPPSVAAEVWRVLERLQQELESEVQLAMTRLSSSRSFREIDEDMQSGTQPKERFFLETIMPFVTERRQWVDRIISEMVVALDSAPSNE